MSDHLQRSRGGGGRGGSPSPSPSAGVEEDSKISKLFRIIVRFDTRDTYFNASKAALERLNNANYEDRRYIAKSFVPISVTFNEAFVNLASGVSWYQEGISQLVRLLVSIHEIIEAQGVHDKVPAWLIDIMIRNARTDAPGRPRVLIAIYDTLKEFITYMSISDIERLPTHLHRGLERIDTAWGFKVMCSTFAQVLSLVTDWQDAGFHDFVDVVIGWMVDEDSAINNSDFCTDFLYKLRPYFSQDQVFVQTLLRQIADDAESEAVEVQRVAERYGNIPIVIKRIMLLMRTFTAIIRLMCVTDKTFLNELTEQMVEINVRVLEFPVIYAPESREHILSILWFLNEIISFCPGIDGAVARSFIMAEIQLLRNISWTDLNFQNFIKLWEAICVWLEGVVSATQLSEEILSIAEEVFSFLDSMEDTREKILLIQALFRTRNVQLLQTVYKWHLSKLDSDGETKVPYVLAGLADIAGNKSSSILAVYALEPPVINLLSDLSARTEDVDARITARELLKCHCVVHTHWLSSLTSTFASQSPGSRFLTHLLKFWIDQLRSPGGDQDVLEEKQWFLRWIYEFLVTAEPYAVSVYETFPYFIEQLLQFLVLYDPKCHTFTNKEIDVEPIPELQESLSRAEEAMLAYMKGEPCDIVNEKEQTEILNSTISTLVPELDTTDTDFGEELDPDAWTKVSWPFFDSLEKVLDLFLNRWSKYCEVVDIQTFVTSLVGKCIFDESCSHCHPGVLRKMVDVLNDLHPLIVSELRLPVVSLTESMMDWNEKLCTDLMSEESQDMFLMPNEAEEFLQQLFRPTKTKRPNSSGDSVAQENAKPSPLRIRAAVDYFVRSKLRTTFGRPQEFFGHIRSCLPVLARDEWKLDFLFMLEQDMMLWSSGSYCKNIGLHENTKMFYVTNRAPCVEWYRLMRDELITYSLDHGQYYYAYFHACLGMDTEKAQLSLFHINDTYSLNGSSYSSRSAWHYLEGRFEKAMELLEQEMQYGDGDHGLLSLISSRCAEALKLDVVEQVEGGFIRSDHTLNPRDFLKPNKSLGYPSILDSQIMFINNYTDVDGNKIKTSLDMTPIENSGAETDIWTVLKLCECLRITPQIPFDQKWEAWLLLAEKMIENGNFNFTEKLLEKLGISWDNFPEVVNTSKHFEGANDINSHQRQKSLMLFAAKLLLKKKEIDVAERLYTKILRETTCFRDYEDNGFMMVMSDQETELDWTLKVVLDIAQGFRWHYPQFLSILENIGLDGISESQFPAASSDNGICVSLEAALQRHVLLEKCLDLSPLDSTLWLALGNAYHDIAQSQSRFEDSRPLNKKEFDALCNHLRFSPASKKKESDQTVVKVISRIITLIQTGHRFDCDPKDVLVNQKWLSFLPEIAHTPYLRPHILYRFPQTSSLYLWFYSTTSSNLMSLPEATLAVKCPVQGAGGYLTDPAEIQSTLDKAESQISLEDTRDAVDFSKCDLGIDARTDCLATEILRIGTTPEELWSWAVQKILGDWNRRMAVLRKEVTRDPTLQLNVNCYMRPLGIYLEQIWEYTLKTAQSTAQLGFVSQNSDIIGPLLDSLKDSGSLDALQTSFEKLVCHCENLESNISYRTPMAYVSRKLADLKEWGNDLTILGMPTGVTISNITPIVLTLATKTKPKKIRFIGSNGKYYEFLVKGNENLHVDSGMMQLFNLSQSFIKHPIWTYAVTPLGKRGGLIQMVGNACPVFRLYKNYLLKASHGEKNSEIFWKKAQELGFPAKSRSMMDPAMLRDVFRSLQDSVPSDLISRELLLAAKDVRHWFDNVKGFTRDVAVSAAIGYLIGVGDRHLDNILIIPAEGKMIHVDFSLVFWRGERLRVPECVPFRLTQNFVGALQYPGLKGSFPNYMEDTLSAFKSNVDVAEFLAKTVAFAYLMDDESSTTKDGLLADLTEEDLQNVNPLAIKVEPQIRQLVTKFCNKIYGLNYNTSVDLLIADATNDQNLCRMYEGWAPWV